MIDFDAELAKLLALESPPLPDSEMEVYAAESRFLIQSLDKEYKDLSLQIEEVYDMLKESETDALAEAFRDAQTRVIGLAQALMDLCDLVDDFNAFAQQSGDEELKRQALHMRRHADSLITERGFSRLGEEGQWINPAMHTVQAATASAYPREHIAAVLRYGYRYLGNILRKAIVIVSTGMEEPNNEQNHWY